MQKDFHYYATYCAAFLAGYSHEESLTIAYSAQYVDECTATRLSTIKGPLAATTTQLQLELLDTKPRPVELQNITRIWASFHFLPYDLNAKCSKWRPKRYLHKYRLICKPNGNLLVDTIELAKDKSLQAVGVAMHILADTWAHSYFAGTPSLVINNTNYQFYEITDEGERMVRFSHNLKTMDDPIKGRYNNSLYQSGEYSIMNLGHGRAGHLPDYSFVRYRYLPAWGDYNEVVKDNPVEYMKAFSQMIYAMKYLRGEVDMFAKETYADETFAQYREEIDEILRKRQLDACADWKAFGEKLSGQTMEDFEVKKYESEYMEASKEDKPDTFLGRFFLAAMAQKSMVTNRIYKSKNRLAGISIEYDKKGFKGIKDFKSLINYKQRNQEESHDTMDEN